MKAYAYVGAGGRIVSFGLSYGDIGDSAIEIQNAEVMMEPWVLDFHDFVIVDGEAVFSPAPERLAQYEEAERQKNHQELMDALPDAVADLSELVSDNTVDMADVMDALADLSEIVSNLMEEE